MHDVVRVVGAALCHSPLLMTAQMAKTSDSWDADTSDGWILVKQVQVCLRQVPDARGGWQFGQVADVCGARSRGAGMAGGGGG